MIRVQQISHHFGHKPILKDVSLSVPTGELLAVMGPNGAGKSTLLSAIAGLILPAEGHVEVDGKRRRSSAPDEMAIRQKMAYLPASPWMAMNMKVLAWLGNLGHIYGIPTPRVDEHSQSLLELFHLTEHMDTPIRSCSTGQRKKVAICGALITEASYLVLDEPFTGGLDPSAIRALERVLKHLADEEQRTVVIASQLPELVEAVADRLAIINDNRLAAIGTLDELREQAQCAGTLSEVFEKLTQPQSEDEVDRYLRVGGSGGAA